MTGAMKAECQECDNEWAVPIIMHSDLGHVTCMECGSKDVTLTFEREIKDAASPLPDLGLNIQTSGSEPLMEFGPLSHGKDHD